MYSDWKLAGVLILQSSSIFQELVVSLNSSFTQEYGMVHKISAVKVKECLEFPILFDKNLDQMMISPFSQVPDSCCKSVSRFCGVRDHPSNIYYTGCAHKLSIMASDHLLLIGTIALVICAVEACGVVLSATLVRKLNKLED